MFVPLTVAVTKTPQDRLRTEASYDSNLIDEGLATSMLESFGSILADILCDPQGPVSSTEACSLRDRHLIHDHTRDMEPGHCELVHDVIGQFFRTTPGRMAICSASEGDMTYGELDDLSSRLAHYLVSLGGVGPEQYVFSCFHKSTWANVARLAIMRSGSAYVSINAKSPPAYLSDVVKRTRARIMLTMPEFEGEFSGYVQHTVPLSRAFLEALPRHESPPVTDVRPDNACLVLFTSGSTGEPKGIVQTHQAYATSIADYARRLRLGPHTRFFQADDYHYDISNIEFFAPLSVGGSCIVPQSHVVHNIPDMVANIRALKPNIAFFTPTMLVRLTDTDALSSLDIICVGGELVPSDVVARWNSKHKTTRLVNQYGMGEVAVACTLNQTLRSEESMNVGQSASGAIWIADPACPERLMPVGAVGEIIIEGRHLSRHYLPPLSEATARPATEAIFLDGAPGWLHELHQDRALAIQSPHSGPDIPTRLYRSGDLGRLLHDGSIQHLGRKDTMLKLDGCRVEALDVEHNARTCLDSTDAIVVDVVGEVGGRRWPILVAYLYLENKGTAVMTGSSPKKPLPSISDAEADPVGAVKVDEIKNALARVLDPSMIPLRWFLLSSLPRTPSGKTDRKTLHVMGQKTYMQEVF